MHGRRTSEKDRHMEELYFVLLWLWSGSAVITRRRSHEVPQNAHAHNFLKNTYTQKYNIPIEDLFCSKYLKT